jgi:hypothetical protein
MAGDIYYNSVSLLLHCNGADNSTTFTDNSPTPKTVTANGNAKISTVQSKFGGASGLFDGTGDFLTFPGSTEFNLGTADFTLEGWFRFSDMAGAGDALFLLGNSTTNRPLGLYRLSGRELAFGVSTGGSNYTEFDTTTSPLTAGGLVWHHVAVVRASNTLSIYVDGVVTNVANASYTGAIANAPATNYISRIPWSTSVDFVGNINDIRFTKGVARYTANFTPPALAFPDSYVQLQGNITESSAITNWRATATKCSDGTFVGTALSGEAGTSYNIDSNTLSACNITLSPKIDYAWSVARATTLNDYVVAVNPDTTPHLWKCTTAGTTHATTEPTWNLSSTTTDNTVTWTYVAPLVDPVTIGPKIPS